MYRRTNILTFVVFTKEEYVLRYWILTLPKDEHMNWISNKINIKNKQVSAKVTCIYNKSTLQTSSKFISCGYIIVFS